MRDDSGKADKMELGCGLDHQAEEPYPGSVGSHGKIERLG